MGFAKIGKMFSDPDGHGWPLRVTLQETTLPELEILLGKDGRISKEEALEIINRNRAKKGLDPIHAVP